MMATKSDAGLTILPMPMADAQPDLVRVLEPLPDLNSPIYLLCIQTCGTRHVCGLPSTLLLLKSTTITRYCLEKQGKPLERSHKCDVRLGS